MPDRQHFHSFAALSKPFYPFIISYSFLASFRMVFRTNKQIHRLNQNALVSHSNHEITQEKVKTNILRNPHTIFLAPTNSTVDKVNNFVINVLFRDQTPLMVMLMACKIRCPYIEI